MFGEGYIPYCGAAPAPGMLAWTLDPILLLVLAFVAVLHLRHARAMPVARRRVAAAGWAVVALALISPLCNLSVALFSARVAQHMIMIFLGAPLIALAMRGASDKPAAALLPVCAFAVALWLWHWPGPYDATLRSDLVYWAMHVSLFGSALWLWRTLLDGATAGIGKGLLASLVTGIQMSILGAILTFAPQALFTVHADTTGPWGLTAMEDQQLGGLVMWVPGGLLLMIYALSALALLLRKLARQDAELAPNPAQRNA